MPRPPKERNVCCMPRTCRFGPLREWPQDEALAGTQCKTAASACTVIRMTIDEYETLRLIDLLGLTQEECARRMGIARTTVQMVYNEARRKTADALVNGKPLYIEGGHYRLCDGSGRCPAGECPRRQNHMPLQPKPKSPQPCAERSLQSCAERRICRPEKPQDL